MNKYLVQCGLQWSSGSMHVCGRRRTYTRRRTRQIESRAIQTQNVSNGQMASLSYSRTQNYRKIEIECDSNHCAWYLYVRLGGSGLCTHSPNKFQLCCKIQIATLAADREMRSDGIEVLVNFCFLFAHFFFAALLCCSASVENTHTYIAKDVKL